MGSACIGMVTKLPTVTKTTDRCIPVNKQNKGMSFDVPFTIEHGFQNGFNIDVSIMFRNGMGFTIPKTSFKWRPSNDFIVFVKYKFSSKVKIDIHHLLDEVNDDSPKMLQGLREAFSQSMSSITYNGNEVTVAYPVSFEMFSKAKGSLYLENLDITLALNQETETCLTVHPCSNLGKEHLERMTRPDGYNYRIIINDPDCAFGVRYINLSGRVYRIAPQIISDKEPGVYFQVSDSGEVIEEHLYDFEQADTELMLYKTASDAKVFGNILEARRKELEETQHAQKLKMMEIESENIRLKHESESQLNKIKQERAQMDAELSKIQSENKQRELMLQKNISELENQFAKEKAYRDDSLNRMKLEYERRSLDRKDSSEIIKWLPAIVTGGFLLYKKLF